MNYTKGEWRATPFEVITESTTIADCVLGKLKQPDITLDEAGANAHLIAAAPDMYEALKMLMFQFVTAVEHPYSKDKEIYEQAEKAIAKAEGKQ